MKHVIYMLLVFSAITCTSEKKKIKKYNEHIGDTFFNPKKDNSDFAFCDSTKVFHSRSKVQYTGSSKALETELINQYQFKSIFKNFSGYFFIRFAVNCKNETGRFRYQIVDDNFKETSCNEELVDHIISLTKSLKGWNHVKYNDKSYDGYTFLIVKLINGEIVKS